MSPVFDAYVGRLPGKLDLLLTMPPASCGRLIKQTPLRGVYLFTEHAKHLYVGRSNRLRTRVRNHGNPCATFRQAAFAFRLAREVTGKIRASYTPAGSRKALMLDPTFAKAFEQAKARIGAMEVRFVEEADPLAQCLLEIYVAVSLGTPYNDFENH